MALMTPVPCPNGDGHGQCDVCETGHGHFRALSPDEEAKHRETLLGSPKADPLPIPSKDENAT